jgi:hypothetical protein
MTTRCRQRPTAASSKVACSRAKYGHALRSCAHYRSMHDQGGWRLAVLLGSCAGVPNGPNGRREDRRQGGQTEHTPQNAPRRKYLWFHFPKRTYSRHWGVYIKCMPGWTHGSGCLHSDGESNAAGICSSAGTVVDRRRQPAAAWRAGGPAPAVGRSCLRRRVRVRGWFPHGYVPRRGCLRHDGAASHVRDAHAHAGAGGAGAHASGGCRQHAGGRGGTTDAGGSSDHARNRHVCHERLFGGGRRRRLRCHC